MSPAIFLQYVLPHRLLSRLARSVAYCRVRWFKDWLIALAISHFKINVAEAADPADLNAATELAVKKYELTSWTTRV